MIKERAYIGIDPGYSQASPGAMALIEGRFIEVYDWTTEVEMCEQLKTWLVIYDVHCAALEEVHAQSYLTRDKRTGIVSAQSQKGSSNFNFGANYGFWRGVLLGLDVPFELVKPSEWMGSYNLRKKINRKDKPSLDVAREMYPGAPLKYKKNHGRADALLIATWLRKKYASTLR